MAEFKIPPISTLAGTTIQNYFKVIKGKKISSKFYFKNFLTQLVILISTPFHVYENLKYGRKTEKFSFKKPPLFILGHWRSGTTHLHNMLCQATDAAYITTYNSLFPSNLGSKFIFKKFMSLNMPEKRPSDNVKLNVDYPQEDEFALGNLCPYSYYNFFYFPEDYREFYQHYVRFKGVSQHVKTEWANQYKKLITKAILNTGGEQVIIKNPVNTGRVDKLLELFPDAKFIHIYRNPYLVYLSTKKFFLELCPTLWFHEVSEQFIEKMIIEIYANLYQDFFEKKALLHEGNFIEFSFEDFERDPMSHIRLAYEKLDLGNFEGQKIYFEKYLLRQKGYKKNAYAISEREMKVIDEKWSMFYQKWNYIIPEEIIVN